MDHGSLQNMMGANSVSDVKPEVGMGVTTLYWTDRKAGTIVEVSKSGKRFWYTFDDVKRIDNNGMSECQRYECTPVPDGSRTEVYKTRDGRWRERGKGSFIQLNCKRPYHDFSF